LWLLVSSHYQSYFGPIFTGISRVQILVYKAKNSGYYYSDFEFWHCNGENLFLAYWRYSEKVFSSSFNVGKNIGSCLYHKSSFPSPNIGHVFYIIIFYAENLRVVDWLSISLHSTEEVRRSTRNPPRYRGAIKNVMNVLT
jgi:hypothetical protein